MTKVVTEQDARKLGREAGYRSMRRNKRKMWNNDDAAAAIVEYRKVSGRPDTTIHAAEAALTDLTGAVGSRNHVSRPSKQRNPK